MKLLRLLLCWCGVLACVRGAEIAVESAEKLKLGMSRLEVIALMGEPHATSKGSDGDALHYRLALVRPDEGQSGGSQLAVDCIRCDFCGDRLCHIAGLWPKVSRPPAGTLRENVMLVDTMGVFDQLVMWRDFREQLGRARDQDEAWVQKQNAEGNKLLAAWTKAKADAKRMPAKSAGKSAAEARAQQLHEQIEAKQKLITDFIRTETDAAAAARQMFLLVRLPEFSDALLAYGHAHGFTCFYEIRFNVFSSALKPLFVSGVDVSKDVGKWIDSGGAKEFGLGVDATPEAAPAPAAK